MYKTITFLVLITILVKSDSDSGSDELIKMKKDKIKTAHWP
jgi:hypothetical protein